MWILIVSFVALNAPPPGILTARFNTVQECHDAGERKQAEIRHLYGGRLIANFECLRGA
jgi:hypothetical protein